MPLTAEEHNQRVRDRLIKAVAYEKTLQPGFTVGESMPLAKLYLDVVDAVVEMSVEHHELAPDVWALGLPRVAGAAMADLLYKRAVDLVGLPIELPDYMNRRSLNKRIRDIETLLAGRN